MAHLFLLITKIIHQDYSLNIQNIDLESRANTRLLVRFSCAELMKRERLDQRKMVFTCSICEKKFSTKSNCNRHVRRIHGKEAANNTSNISVTLPDPTNVQSVGRQTNPALQSGRMPPLIEDPDSEDDTNQLSQLRKNK